jgi:hypothetical protein
LGEAEEEHSVPVEAAQGRFGLHERDLGEEAELVAHEMQARLVDEKQHPEGADLDRLAEIVLGVGFRGAVAPAKAEEETRRCRYAGSAAELDAGALTGNQCPSSKPLSWVLDTDDK